MPKKSLFFVFLPAFCLFWSRGLYAQATPDSDGAVAEWVLRVGGAVAVEGMADLIWDIDRLPSSDFRVRTVNLAAVTLAPQDLKNLNSLPHLKELYLSGRT